MVIASSLISTTVSSDRGARRNRFPFGERESIAGPVALLRLPFHRFNMSR
jgi:hypothetical protein